MDTWNGNNFDPITLHKYAYGNADPVTYADPTGNFGLGSFGVSFNIQGVLATANVASTAYSFLDLALSGETPTASQIGTEILLSMLGGSAGKLLKMLPKKAQDKLSDAFDGVGCFFNSFPAGTLVHTEKGLIPIEEVVIGDKVLAFDEITGETSYEEVTHLIQSEQGYNFVIVSLENDAAVEATPEHPFYTGSAWIQANNLVVGDSLQLIDGMSSILDVSREVRIEKVFNLTVGNKHTFYVTEAGVLVHNANKNAGCKFRGLKAKGFKWDDILRKHSPTGRTHLQRSRESHTYFAGLTDKQIKARVQGAWKNRELKKSQTSFNTTTGKEEIRLYYEGIDPKSGQTVGMYFNRTTQIVETAFPVH